MLMDDFDDDNTFGEYIKSIYYFAIPYEYRPHELWYKLKCLVWHRYTTVKPRQLGHTWCDKSELLKHVMFEILEDFLENECNPGNIDWEASDHRIIYGNHSRNVIHVMRHISNWWIYIYSKKHNNEYNAWHNHFSKYTLNDNIFSPIWASKEYELQSEKLFKRAMKKELAISKELENNLIMIVKCRPFMWT